MAGAPRRIPLAARQRSRLLARRPRAPRSGTAADGSLEFLAPVAAARAEAAWLEGRTDTVEVETARALALAIRLQDGWAAGELAVWRRRAGIVDELPGGLAKGPFALELAGDHRAAADAWRKLGMPYEAALARASSDDEAVLRAALDELQALGATAAAATVARRLREKGARGLPRGPRATTTNNPAGSASPMAAQDRQFCRYPRRRRTMSIPLSRRAESRARRVP